MNLKEIREIINLMNENDLMEVEVEREGSKIKLKKTAGDPVYSAPAPGVVSSSPVAPAAGVAQVAVVKDNTHYQGIKSPMVGTFYIAPGPDADPFVKAGDIVEVGQVVAIVEAMKLMNEIKSEVRGKIIGRSVDNAQPVEFGQTLFEVEPV